MKPSTASDLAIALGLLAWPLCLYGVSSLFVDFARDTPRAVVEAHELRAVASLATGLACLLSSVWLSGHAYAGAWGRSVIAAIVAAGLVVLAIAATLP